MKVGVGGNVLAKRDAWERITGGGADGGFCEAQPLPGRTIERSHHLIACLWGRRLDTVEWV